MMMMDAPVTPPPDAPAPPTPDAATPDASAPDKPMPDASLQPDGATRDVPGADVGADAPGSDAPRDAMADRGADTGADAMASPCPGAMPPADYDLRCGCAMVGKVLCSGACSVDDTSCVPTGQYFTLSNQFLGDGRVLDTFGGPRPNNATMAMPGNSGSRWKITALGGGHYRLANQFLMDTRALESTPTGDRLFMGDSGMADVQAWRITGAGNGYFRIRSRSFGSERSLDTKPDGANDPVMNRTGDYSGQYWKLTRQP
jgi:hypothetical protein